MVRHGISLGCWVTRIDYDSGKTDWIQIQQGSEGVWRMLGPSRHGDWPIYEQVLPKQWRIIKKPI